MGKLVEPRTTSIVSGLSAIRYIYILGTAVRQRQLRKRSLRIPLHSLEVNMKLVYGVPIGIVQARTSSQIIMA
jgi:hypothetical protein